MSLPRVVEPELVPAVVPGTREPPGGSDLVDWLTLSTRRGHTVTAAVPPIYSRYATVVIPDDDTAKTLADAALIDVLRAHTLAPRWWLESRPVHLVMPMFSYPITDAVYCRIVLR